MPLGTLPAATAENPNVLVLTRPLPSTPYHGGRVMSPSLGGHIDGNQVVSLFGGPWSVIGLYAPGGVSLTYANASPNWPIVNSTEEGVAAALASGDVAELERVWLQGLFFESVIMGNTKKITNFSTATDGGFAGTRIVATPEPGGMVLMGAAAALATRRRGRRPSRGSAKPG